MGCIMIGISTPTYRRTDQLVIQSGVYKLLVKDTLNMTRSIRYWISSKKHEPHHPSVIWVFIYLFCPNV